MYFIVLYYFFSKNCCCVFYLSSYWMFVSQAFVIVHYKLVYFCTWTPAMLYLNQPSFSFSDAIYLHFNCCIFVCKILVFFVLFIWSLYISKCENAIFLGLMVWDFCTLKCILYFKLANFCVWTCCILAHLHSKFLYFFMKEITVFSQLLLFCLQICCIFGIWTSVFSTCTTVYLHLKPFVFLHPKYFYLDLNLLCFYI